MSAYGWLSRGARVVLAATLAVAAVPSVSASAGTPAAAAAATSASGAFSATETVTRGNFVNGQQTTVDSRKVTLHVNQTKDLRGRQEINVSWSGAHPTGGIVADQNSVSAEEEEYPMVLLECRDVTTKGATANWVTPQTCWTQSWLERYQESYQTPFPSFRLDEFATASDRGSSSGAPNPMPSACTGLYAPTQHWVSFTAANGTVYGGGPSGCAGQPPEAGSVTGTSMPSNETFGVTGLDGTGSARFDVWTSAENASLGCSQTVACSLVAIPIEGISCDPSFAKVPPADRPSSSQIARSLTPQVISDCESTGAFDPGQIVIPQDHEALSVSGGLWWSASNWRNRIVVPLAFGPPADACSVVSNSQDIDVYGSELMIPATQQWSPHFCLNPKLFKFTHVQTGEPQARNLVASGSAEAAFASLPQPGGYSRPVVNAPVAITGFAISYVIDGADGKPYTSLKLNARLLAKLLTESYPADQPIQQSETALSGNPLNITLDPEFQQLNPGIAHGTQQSEAASTLLAIASNSDVIRALTTYINDDPSARAWLDGQPDQWGMVVNPAYRGIDLPVDEWPLLSTATQLSQDETYYAKDFNDCLFHNPVPYLPLVASPLASLEEVAEAMQFSIAQSTTSCSFDGVNVTGEKLVALGRQTLGYRFMIGITSLADADLYGVNTAALATGPSTYVAPSVASLKAAAALLKPDARTGTWPVPYKSLAMSGLSAYPGTMVVYAAIPTKGVPASDAQDYAEFLDFASSSGQTQGYGVGQLPPGYLPMTKANGLTQLAAYTQAAARAVAAQKGALPSLTGNVYATNPQLTATATPTTTPTVNPTVNPTVTPTASPTSAVASSAVPVPVPTAVVSSAHPPTPPATPTPSVSTATPEPTVSTSPAAQVVDLANASNTGLGGAGGVVVTIVVAALAGCVLLPLTYLLGRRRRLW